MATVSKLEWTKALTSIIEELDDSQLKEILDVLEIPKQRTSTKPRKLISQIIIEFCGVETSIHKISDAVDRRQQRDEAVQKHLQPFVDRLKSKEEEKKGQKRKHKERDSKSEDETPEAGFKKNNIVSDSSSDEEAEADELKSPRPDKERKIPQWRISIHDLKFIGDHGDKSIAGKVVKKSGLRTYRTRNEEEKFFFYLGVANETSSFKVMVYRRERYQFFSEGSCYLFRDVIMEKDVMKVTKMSNISKIPPLHVPENLEMEAQMLVEFQIPVCSIAQANTAEEKISVSVEGTITEIGSVENIKLKAKRRKKDKQEFKLEDGTSSIRVTLWGDDIKHLRGKSRGDVVRVTNVRTSIFHDTVSLNSTDFTKIFQVQSAPVQTVTIEIIGIITASRIQTELDAQLDSGEVQSFVVDSSLLAEVFGVRLEGDFEDRLLGKMPFSADVEIKGNKINRMNATNEM